MLYAGIDAGSRAIKAVLVDGETKQIVRMDRCDQGVEQGKRAAELYDRILRDTRKTRDDVQGLVATGYGRNLIDFAGRVVTEISCHARGVRHLVSDVRTIVDIGGQDSKLIRLNEAGKVHDFAMNDRCAAGTGRFLEVVAERLGVALEDLGELASKSTEPASISSMCVVFAETEIIGLMASGVKSSDIVAGVQRSIAQRMAGMAGRNVTEPVVFTGGVALVPGMQSALEASLKSKIRIAPDCQYTG
ncbi:MAG: acyl-CoA dehydratase activase, partial [Candidatus Sumerlaeia bacterium]